MSNDPIDLVETKAIYVRTSTSDQDGAAQLHALHHQLSMHFDERLKEGKVRLRGWMAG